MENSISNIRKEGSWCCSEVTISKMVYSGMNSKGELVGLLFDGNWESIIADWDFIPAITRTIHVDMRYVLWIMEELDGADHLLREMGIEPKGQATSSGH